MELRDPGAQEPVSFDDALRAASGVEGWMTDGQARMLWDAALGVEPPAQIVEIGSYRGRSAIVLAGAAREGVRIVAIDPHAGNDRGPGQWESPAAEGERDHQAFLSNLERAGVAERVRHVRRPSQEALDEVDGPLAMVYVDGAHRYAPASADIERWGARLSPGGTLLVHDSFSSVGVTLALLRLLAFGREFRYDGRSRSLTHYTRVPLRGRERARNAARQLAQLPWFARNLAIKLALVARLRPLARLLGSSEWPY
jgi:predicted O-methyltransferase YrrM